MRERDSYREGGGLQPRTDQAKNTALYVLVFIKHDELSHYINTIEADSTEKAENWAAGQEEIDRRRDGADPDRWHIWTLRHLHQAAELSLSAEKKIEWNKRVEVD